MKVYLPKINFYFLVGAVFLLLLPWTVVQCNGEEVGTQNGLQVAYGGFSPSPRFESMADEDESKSSEESDADFAILTTLSILVLLIGLLSAALHLFKGQRNHKEAGLLACIAFGCIFVQSLIGTPVERSVKETYTETNDPDTEMDEAVRAMVNIDVKYTTWFYLYMLCLAVPAGLYIRGIVRPDEDAVVEPSTKSDDI